MKFSDLEKLDKLLYLNVHILSSLFPTESAQNLKNRLSYLVKYRKLIRLKRDFYITSAQFENYKNYPEYFAMLACALKKPSYLSLEFVLRKHNILTEGTYGITLITTKSRISYQNQLGSFIYNQIRNPLYCGYQRFTFLDGEYWQATKAKALFDWLYFRLPTIPYQQPGINLVEELRLNMEAFNPDDYLELQSYIKLVYQPGPLSKIINNICDYAPNFS